MTLNQSLQAKLKDSIAWGNKHLFLLIGENPLPNYVTARLLQSPHTKLHLIHSTNTSTIAERLKASLVGTIETISLADQQANGFVIHQKIQNHLKSLKKRGELNGAIGLHYTGGTKAMAVHAYRSLLDWHSSNQQSNPIVFSYLDSYRLMLCIENHQTQSIEEIPVGTALDPQPDLKTILQLHGLKWKSEPSRQPVLVELHEKLNGQELENYVMSQIFELKDKYELHDIARSLEIEDPYKNRDLPQFEFDVIFLRGYQLFGISCTTSNDHKICKQKLFEAYSRAQQMGGNEVRVALVSMHKNPNNLLQELNLVNEDAKILVIGKNELRDLTTNLENWICKTSNISKIR